MPTRQNDGQVLVTVKADGTGDVGHVYVVGVCLAVHWPKSVFFVLVGGNFPGNFDRRWNLLAENRLFRQKNCVGSTAGQQLKKLCWLNSCTTAAQQLHIHSTAGRCLELESLLEAWCENCNLSAHSVPSTLLTFALFCRFESPLLYHTSNLLLR